MQEVDAWLEELLEALPEESLSEAKTEIKAKLLESYRNGLSARDRGTRAAPRAGDVRRVPSRRFASRG